MHDHSHHHGSHHGSDRHDPHGHDHHGHHHHAPQTFGYAFAIGAALNIALVGVEIAWGLIANSTALLADAGHNAGDILGILIAWGASALSRRPPTLRYTYGLRGSSILAALANAVILLVATGAIGTEAIMRLIHPEPVAAVTVMIVAGVGIVVNVATAWLFSAGEQHDLNIRAVFLHMAADAGLSFGVVAAGAVILLLGWTWIDPIVSLVIAGVIVWGTWGLLTQAVRMSLSGAPKHVEPTEVRRYLCELPGVSNVHDLHIWSMSTTETALTCHLLMPGGFPGDAFIVAICKELHERFRIDHPTVQIEIDPDTECALAPEHVV